MVGIVLDSVASTEVVLVQYDSAREHWKECFEIVIGIEDTWLSAYVLEGRARLALLEHDPELCIRLLGAGDAARRSIGAVCPEYWLDVIATSLKTARDQVSDSVADTAWHEGQTMTAQEIMAAVIAS